MLIVEWSALTAEKAHWSSVNMVSSNKSMNKPPPTIILEDRHPPARDFCYVCFKAASFCICDGIVPVDNKTRIVIVQHKCERSHPVGTTRIASLGLLNTELKVVWPNKNSKFTFEPHEMKNPGLLFPGPAAIGLLLLIGAVVNNGIMMIEHINMYRRRGMPRHEAMIRGGRERLRPILTGCRFQLSPACRGTAGRALSGVYTSLPEI